MKVREVLAESADDAALATALEFLRNRAHNKKLKGTHSIASIVNMVRNIGGNETFSAMDLKRLADTDPAVQNIIKSIDDNGEVSFQPFGDEIDLDVEEKPDMSTDGPAKDPEKIVGAMAKRAASNRS